MKIQILRFSLHQNAKVMALMMAICSLFMIVPMTLAFWLTVPPGMSVPWGMYLLMPLFYLVFGYISVAVGALVYNSLARKVGGVEYIAEVTRTEPPAQP